MLAISGYVDWPEALRNEIRPSLEAIAERSRRDDGCLDYWWAEDWTHPGRFRFFEAWRDETSHRAHSDADYERVFIREILSQAIGAGAYRYELSAMEEIPSTVSEPPEASR